MEYSVYPEFKSMEWKSRNAFLSRNPARKATMSNLEDRRNTAGEGMKTLDEARGYIVADYLRTIWKASGWNSVRKEYEVSEVNQKVLTAWCI